ncbi:MLP-like protein 28 [Humulus lupulus]|uniref:MLP-like protein 28 n=1 Tax=Humulus lupulus TaxID=3486 RepID=UPI002B41008E|nr:MLP-like protein 28 [Humulus lupulus]
MAKIAKLEVQVELKSSAERFFEIINCKQHLIPKISPDIVKDNKLIKGDLKSKNNNNTFIGFALLLLDKSETAKHMVEELDEENKLITLKMIDGDVMKYYNNVKATFHVTGNMGQKGSLVKWTFEYEKMNDNIPDPTKYAELSSVIIKSIDAYLIKNA